MRAHALGVEIGHLPVGAPNAITDVDGVWVGHTTLIDGDDVRTGATIVRLHGGDPGRDPVFVGAAAVTDILAAGIRAVPT